MIAHAEREAAVATIATSDGASARALADGYLRYASASWRGDPGAAIFGIRLGAYWQPRLARPCLDVPHAFSPHGAGGRGIAWRQIGEEVVGAIDGCRGGYVVPVAAIPRLLRCVPAFPCTENVR